MPTFGHTSYENNGIFISYYGIDYIYYYQRSGCKFTIPQTGTPTSITAYLLNTSAGTIEMSCAIYEDSAGYPGALVATTNTIDVTAAYDAWLTFTISGTPTLKGNRAYWLFGQGEEAPPAVRLKGLWMAQANIGGLNQQTIQQQTGAPFVSWTDPFPAAQTQAQNLQSIYCTYTPKGLWMEVIGDFNFG